MPLTTSFIPSEDRLDLSFAGDLDLTITDEVFRVFAAIPTNLQTCVIDLTRLDRVFDSGLALLWMLNERLRHIGARVVVLSDHPELLSRIQRIMSNVLSVVPQDSALAPRTG
ncbi:MAG: STAS domain-containing protein [Thermochromatium sp.]